MFPAGAHAAGLGRLAIISALGQPFNAEIDLVAVKKEEQSSLMAQLASQGTFRQANIDYAPFLSTFRTSIENRSDGQPYVKITSSQPINEPLLNLLIELNWPSGRLLREYTVLLAPPEVDAHPPATPPTPSNQSKAPGSAKSTKVETAAVEKLDLPIKSPIVGEKPPVPETLSNGKAHSVYGPVKRGDTLAGIARTIVPPTGLSVNQMLVALHRANRGAFFGNNMHRLKTGPVLRVPDDTEIGTITPAEADKEVKMHTVDWSRYKLAELAGLIPPDKELKQTVTGKIDFNVEADAAASPAPQDEILKLSKGEKGDEPWNTNKKDAGGKGNGGKNEGKDNGGAEARRAQDRLRAMEEDALAQSRSLNEANERVALLEKNIEELQRLLVLKNLALADMQKRVEAIGRGGAASQDPPGEISSQEKGLTPEPVSPNDTAFLGGEAAGNIDEATVAPPGKMESATEIAQPMQAAKKPGEETDSTPRGSAENSLVDDVAANIEYLGGALFLLITGIVGVSMIGRPKEAPQDNSGAGMISSTSSSPLQDKAELVATSAATSAVLAVNSAPGTDFAMQPDQADENGPTAEARDYLNAPDSETRHDTSAEEGGNTQPHELSETRATPEELSRPSEPAPSAYVSPASSTVASAEAGLADVSFNLDGTHLTKPGEFAEKNTRWHEIVTKLDLARAYQEMGDKEAARQVLQEVAREGDAQQQESARLMLAAL